MNPILQSTSVLVALIRVRCVIVRCGIYILTICLHFCFICFSPLILFSHFSVDHDDQVQLLQSKIIELESEKRDFGSQRAKMKSFMLQSEAEKVRLQSELEEIRRQLAVMDMNSKSDLEEEKRKYFDHIASLERLLDGW